MVMWFGEALVVSKGPININIPALISNENMNVLLLKSFQDTTAL